MSVQFVKPENALKRANELLLIGNKRTALEVLHGTLISKRHRTWQPTHEVLMLKYLDICVDLQQSRMAKDGLHQYRNLSQQQSPESLENVIKYLIDAAEGRARDARARADQLSLAAASNVDDLEAEQTPESIMMSTMTDNGDEERRDRAVVVPWLKFLWETYRTVLDILRTNSNLIRVYQSTAIKAFEFCTTYKRTTEFRRLCEILRTHLNAIHKNATELGAPVAPAPTTAAAAAAAAAAPRALRGWDGWSPEAADLHLQMRFAQLEVATKLELWTEGYRTVEDIHTLRRVTGTVPKAQLMATYYEKLAQIFWVSGNHLFHAYALFRFFMLSKAQNLSLTQEQLRSMGSQVLLAALSIPTLSSDFSLGGGGKYDRDMTKDKHARMASLLYFSSNPSREALLRELDSKNFDEHVLPELRGLRSALEARFHPLSMVKEISPVLAFLRTYSSEASEAGVEGELIKYAPQLEKLVVLRLLKQLSEVYATISMGRFQALLAGLDIRMQQVEKLIVRAASQRWLRVGVDHRRGCLVFGEEALEADHMCGQLTELANHLRSVVSTIDESKGATTAAADAAAAKPAAEAKADAVAFGPAAADRAVYFQAVRKITAEDHLRVSVRKATIERRKEEAERRALQKKRDLVRKAREEEAARREQEKERLEKEAKEREAGKLQRVRDEIQLKEAKRYIEQLGKDAGELLDIKDLSKVDTTKLVKEAREKAVRAKEDSARKLREQVKRLDYTTRAWREAEKPLLATAHTGRVAQEKERLEANMAAAQQKHKENHAAALVHKARYARMAAAADQFRAKVMDGRKQEYDVLAAAAKAEASKQRMERRLARARRRRAEAEEEAEAEREEAARQAQREAEEAAQAEKRAAEEAEEAAAAAAAAKAAEQERAQEERETTSRSQVQVQERVRAGWGVRQEDRGDRDRRDAHEERGRGEGDADAGPWRRGGGVRREDSGRSGWGSRDESRDERGGGPSRGEDDRWGRRGGDDSRRGERDGGDRWARGAAVARDDRRDDRGGWGRGGGGEGGGGGAWRPSGGASGGAGAGGWRDRIAQKQQGGGASAPAEEPKAAPASGQGQAEEAQDDGFTTVKKKGRR